MDYMDYMDKRDRNNTQGRHTGLPLHISVFILISKISFAVFDICKMF